MKTNLLQLYIAFNILTMATFSNMLTKTIWRVSITDNQHGVCGLYDNSKLMPTI